MAVGLALVGAVVALTSCGVAPGDARPGSAAARPVPSDWHHITMCGADGPVTVRMPRGVQFDGPRELRNIDEPASGTFAWGYTAGQEVRYDAFLVIDAEAYGTTDREVATSVLRQLNGEPEAMRFRSVEERGDHVVGSYDEEFDGRDYRMRFVADGGSIYAVGVGVHEGTPVEIVAQAKAELDVMWHSLDVAGLDGVAPAPCRGSKDVPG